MEDNRLYAIIWTFVAGVLVTALFMVTSCVRNDSQIQKEVSLKCIESGGSMVLVPGRTDTFTCVIK